MAGGKGRGKGSAGAPDASVAKGASESCTRLTPTSHIHTHTRPSQAKAPFFISFVPPSLWACRDHNRRPRYSNLPSPLRLYKFPLSPPLQSSSASSLV